MSNTISAQDPTFRYKISRDEFFFTDFFTSTCAQIGWFQMAESVLSYKVNWRPQKLLKTLKPFYSFNVLAGENFVPSTNITDSSTTRRPLGAQRAQRTSVALAFFRTLSLPTRMLMPTSTSRLIIAVKLNSHFKKRGCHCCIRLAFGKQGSNFACVQVFVER